MTLTQKIAGVAIDGVRWPGGDARAWSLTDAAEKGSVGSSGFDIDDALAAVDPPGFASCAFEDSAATPTRLFTGYLDSRAIGRMPAHRTEEPRVFDVSVTDLNCLLGDIIIRDVTVDGTAWTGKRPAETDIARLDWLLSSPYVRLGIDPARFDRTNPVSLPAADYTGRYAMDVVSDANALSGKNFYVFWSENAFVPWAPADWTGSHTVEEPPAVQTGYVGCATAVVPNGAQRRVIVTFDCHQAYGVLMWYDGSPASLSTTYSPWRDSNGDRLSQVLVASAAPGVHTYDLGICTLDSEILAPDTGWSLLIRSDVSAVATGYAFGWKRKDAGYDPADYLTATVDLYEPVHAPALAYHPTIWANVTAGITVSNAFGEADGVTCFAPAPSDTIGRNPERVYSGCYFEYSGGAIFAENATTKAAFFTDEYRPQRDTRASDMNCKTSTTATALANANLNRANNEEDRGTLNLAHVPAASVNLVRAGDRILVKLTHVPGYESGTYMAVMRKTVAPSGTPGFYDLALEVSLPLLTSYAGVGHPLNPNIIKPAPGSANPLQLLTPTTTPATGIHGQRVARQVIATADGAASSWTLATPYVAGSLEMWVDALAQIADEVDAAAGTAGLTFTPASGDIIEAAWMVD